MAVDEAVEVSDVHWCRGFVAPGWCVYSTHPWQQRCQEISPVVLEAGAPAPAPCSFCCTGCQWPV